jgi:hypothetical protein
MTRDDDGELGRWDGSAMGFLAVVVGGTGTEPDG